MERAEISIHEVKVAMYLQGHEGWVSNRDIAIATQVSERTVRLHTKKLHTLGMVDCAEVFPSHRFKWSDKANKRNGSYWLRLTAAAEVFGLPARGA